METGYSIMTFVPLYIFAPILLIGIVELFRTPTTATSTHTYNDRSTGALRDPNSGAIGARSNARLAT